MQIVDYFLDSLKSPHTKDQYDFHRQRYKKYIDSVGFTATTKDPELLEQNIISYLQKMKEDGLSYSFRNTAWSSIKHQYVMKDIILNWEKIPKFLGEKTLDNEIRAYTHDEIRRMLSVADIKYRAIILTYISTGMRRGALTELKIKDFEYLDTYGLYKIKIYRKTESQQVCFTTPEAAQAIKLYIKDKTPNGYFHDIAPKSVSEQMRQIVIAAGISERHNELAKNERIGQFRDSISSVHSFRKFTITQMKRAKVDTEIAKLLTGHSIGIRAAYLDYSDDDLLEAYVKAIPFLTISEEKELKAQNDQLQAKQATFSSLVENRLIQKDKEIENLKEQMSKMQITLKDFREKENDLSILREDILKLKAMFEEDYHGAKKKDNIDENKKVDKLVKGTAKNIVKKVR